MTIELSWVGVSVIIAVLVHAFTTVRYAIRVGVQLENVNASLIRIDKELEKRDVQITAIWRKLDALSEKVHAGREAS